MIEPASVAEEAWQRLLAQLGETGRIITGPLGGRDDRERAEGFRHITRALAIALEMLLEKGDAAHPEFTRWMTPHRKMLGDNPGTIYDAVLVSPDHAYRITGTKGECAYLGFCLYGTEEDGRRRVVGNIDDLDLATGPDGRYDLWLAASRPEDLPANASFLQLDPDATDILVRQYFHDPRSDAEAEYSITVVPDQGPPPPLTEKAVAAQLDRVGDYVRDVVTLEATISALEEQSVPIAMRSSSAADGPGRAATEIDWKIVAKAMPTPAIQYAGAWFDELGPDEGILVAGTLPECRYVSISWLNRWMESGDYANHRVSMTGRELKTEADGRFRLVIAHRDPGEPNWLDTTGIRNANCTVRSLGAQEPAEVTFSRISLPAPCPDEHSTPTKDDHA